MVRSLLLKPTLLGRATFAGLQLLHRVLPRHPDERARRTAIGRHSFKGKKPPSQAAPPLRRQPEPMQPEPISRALLDTLWLEIPLINLRPLGACNAADGVRVPCASRTARSRHRPLAAGEGLLGVAVPTHLLRVCSTIQPRSWRRCMRGVLRAGDILTS